MILLLVVACVVGCNGLVSPSTSPTDASASRSPLTSSLRIATNGLPVAAVQSDYSATLVATGGTRPYLWTKTGGQLPTGLTLDAATGAVAGTPTLPGSFSFTATVQDAKARSVSSGLSISVALPSTPPLRITTSALPVGAAQNGYSVTLLATGGVPPYSWSKTGGQLPTGLALDPATGTVAGTPTSPGSFSFTATVQDAKAGSASSGLSINVGPPSTSPLRIMTTALPVGAVYSGYSTTLLATGGVPPYVWSKATGQLPSGLTLDPTVGTIAGTPTWAGSFSFAATVQDAKSSSVSTGFSINVSPVSAPKLSAVSPNSGPTEGGSLVTISGSNFRSGALVQFGSSSGASVQVVSSTEIQAVTPAESSGSVDVKVQNSDGQVVTAPGAFTFTDPGPSAPDPTSSADVVVDASQTMSETGGDDLAAAKNTYSSASAPEADGGLYPDWSLIASEFAMKRMRNINGLGDCALDGNGNLTGCSRLNNDLSNIMGRSLTPHVIVGQWAPSSIGGNPLQWGSLEWAQYDALCYAIVNYVASQYGGTGFKEALFEVENEIDTTTDPRDLWLTTSSTVPQGDPSRFTQFDTVYRHWANAVDLVARQNPNKKIRIAGPSTGLWTVYFGSGQLWHNQIIQKYAASRTRLDVVSLHIYGGQVNDLAKYAQSIRSALVATGNTSSEIWVTEWGASDSNGNYFGAINGSHEAAAWGINFLLQALKGTVTGGSFLEVRDNYGHDTAGVNANMNAASWNHVQNGLEYPKAIANAFTMVDRMSGTRKSVTVNGAKPDLCALASSDSSSASLIVANYNYLFDYNNKNYSDLTKTQTVTVAFKNLRFSGPVTVDRYLIDAQTSNFNYWLATGKTPPSVQATQLQKVESFSATSKNGTLSLPARQFGPSAVSLWIVHP